MKSRKNLQVGKSFKQIAFKKYFFFLFDVVKTEVLRCLQVINFAMKSKLITEVFANVDMTSPLLTDVSYFHSLYALVIGL